MGGDVNSRWEEAVVSLRSSCLVGPAAAAIKDTQTYSQPRATGDSLTDGFSYKEKTEFDKLNDSKPNWSVYRRYIFSSVSFVHLCRGIGFS